MKKSVAIFLFDEVEVLDFAGPFEVFSVASEIHDFSLFEVFTVGKTTAPISTVNGLSVNPKYNFENCPDADILIIPGGEGTKALLKDSLVLNWIESSYSGAETVISICSAARIFAHLGILKNKPFCTHREVYENVSEIEPTGIPQKEMRYVKSNEKLYTASGISAGIDVSFKVLTDHFGEEKATTTATYMEYVRNYS